MKSDTVKIILGKLMPKRDDKGESEANDNSQGGSDKQEEYMSAAEEILSAIDKKDAEALAEALHAFVTLCESSEDEGEAVEEE